MGAIYYIFVFDSTGARGRENRKKCFDLNNKIDLFLPWVCLWHENPDISISWGPFAVINSGSDTREKLFVKIEFGKTSLKILDKKRKKLNFPPEQELSNIARSLVPPNGERK
jgi:hypothetical protein